MRRALRAAAVLALLAGAAPAEGPRGDNLVVFVNKDVGVASLDVEEVRQIFLKKKAAWDGGQRIVCVNAKGEALRQAFRERVLAMSAAEEKQYWQEQELKGRGSEPATFSDPVRAVFALKGSVGYAFRSDLKGDVVRIALGLPAPKR